MKLLINLIKMKGVKFFLVALLIIATIVPFTYANRYNEQINGGTCGNPGSNYVGRRIVGGLKALPDEFPYQIILGGFEPYTIFHYIFKKPRKAGFFCGGTVLNDRYILTAAHCLTGEHSIAENLVVGAAITDRDEIVNSHGRIEKVIVHPKYQAHSQSNEHMYDIALLKTAEPISSWAKNEVVPPCLPDVFETASFQMGIVSGFGQISHDGPVSDELLATSVRIRGDKYCKTVYGDLFDPATMICAGEIRGGRDTCQGDSGGPLVGRKNGAYVLLGVTSFGFGCGEKYIPGVYTKVSSYTNWLVANMK